MRKLYHANTSQKEAEVLLISYKVDFRATYTQVYNYSQEILITLLIIDRTSMQKISKDMNNTVNK